MPTGGEVFGLGRLLAPFGAETFEQEYWEQKPLLIRRGDRDYYRDLFTLEHADEIISTSDRRFPGVLLVKDGREVPLAGVLPKDQPGQCVEHIYNEYRKGASIVLPFIHDRWPPLQALCASLSAKCSAGFQTNAYLTPRKEQGLGVHYDTHDVFVLQVEGSKRWRLFESPVRLPLPTQSYKNKDPRPETPTQEFDLFAGDLLYLPRGVVHEALSNDEVSLHLTIGVIPITWAEVIMGVVEAAIVKSPVFRGSLPLGFARDDSKKQELVAHLKRLMTGIRRQAPYKTAVTDAVTRARLSQIPMMRGHLGDLSAGKRVRSDTPVMRRAGLQCWISVLGKEVCLQFHGKEIHLPRDVEKDVRFMAEARQPFTASSLPGRLDKNGRHTIIRRLLREGFLTLKSDAQAVVT